MTHSMSSIYDKDGVQWDNEASELRHKALDNARARATKWEATITALLGLFSTVAIVAGPTSIDKITTDWVRWAALFLILLAGIAAAVAVLFAARAAQGPDPVLIEDLDGQTLEVLTLDRVREATDQLRRSRLFAHFGAGLLFATGFLVACESAYAAQQEPSGSSVVVVDEQGGLRCGKLARDSDGNTTVGGQRVSGVTQAISVERCGQPY